MIIGFESDEEDQNVDYLLAMTDMLITTPKLRIRPLFQRGIDSIRGITLADFKFIRCLGSGGFSLVYLVRAYFNGKLYAMKLISKYLIVPSQRDCILEN